MDGPNQPMRRSVPQPRCWHVMRKRHGFPPPNLLRRAANECRKGEREATKLQAAGKRTGGDERYVLLVLAFRPRLVYSRCLSPDKGLSVGEGIRRPGLSTPHVRPRCALRYCTTPAVSAPVAATVSELTDGRYAGHSAHPPQKRLETKAITTPTPKRGGHFRAKKKTP